MNPSLHIKPVDENAQAILLDRRHWRGAVQGRGAGGGGTEEHFEESLASWCARSYHQYVRASEVHEVFASIASRGDAVCVAYFDPLSVSWKYHGGRAGRLLRVHDGEYVHIRRHDGRLSKVRIDRWGWLVKLSPIQAVVRELGGS